MGLYSGLSVLEFLGCFFAVKVLAGGVAARGKLAVVLVLLALALQVTLGISTLLLHVPVAIAAAHQGGAVLLLSAMLFAAHGLQRAKS